MLARIKRMQKLVELADIELNKASQTLGALQEQHEQEKAQLVSLVTYSKEYANHSFNQTIVLTPIQLQTRYCFGDKLHQAIEAQTEQVKRLEEVADKAREEWQEKKVRKESLLALLTKLKQTHQAEMNKREQRMLDELAAQKVIANRVKNK